MAKEYRALISIEITADDDHAARSEAEQQAGAMLDADGRGGSGHVELVGEVGPKSVRIIRVLHAEPLLLRQLPLDWKP